ncbi:microtubule organization protein AKNA [Chanos chanos]|uniref:Microtubule organization protein AKNA n=1 Tax=Chanos chanos TaxID=29144 RepID=A0A6J2UWV0_CHACN|nr:microtubule organization protein AKNA [Chanos chanos]
MEKRGGSTRAGVLIWTPAPDYTSPTSRADSPGSLDEGREEDFQSQMDENGIIGLGETWRLEEEEEAPDEEYTIDAGTPEPEENPPSALEELSYNLSELLDSEPVSEPTEEDCNPPSHNLELDGNATLNMENWSEDENGKGSYHGEAEGSEKINRQHVMSVPERDGLLDMTEDELEEGEEFGEPQGQTNRSIPITQASTGRDWLEQYDLKHDGVGGGPVTDLLTSEMRQMHTQGSVRDSVGLERSVTPRSPCSPRSLHLSTAPSINRLPSHLSTEELDDNPGIEAETLPEPAFTESLPESRSSQHSHTPRRHWTIEFEGEESMQKSTPLFVCKSLGHKGPNSRKGQLNYPLPDFSKVEPRVRFPKNGYKPPKSKKSACSRGMIAEAPVVFKSPADIVREVLQSSSDRPTEHSTLNDSHRSVSSTVPQEFRCPQHASALVQQLQEDYRRLLTKYAEAENTIDRLRLEAKVGLYSDPPKPCPSAVSGVVQEGSKVMILNFPQAQRAELSTGTSHLTQQTPNQDKSGDPTCPASVDPVSSRPKDAGGRERLTELLYKQAERFLLQVDAFEVLLKKGKLKPFEQIKGLSRLAQGQDSLERGYLMAREEHRLLQRHGASPDLFDPDRELEGQIFRSGMRLEELKEWVEQLEQSRPTPEPPPTPAPHPVPLSSPLKDTDTLPESPLPAVCAEPGVGIGVQLEVSSVSGESSGDGQRDEEEEALPSLLPRSLHLKHQRVERDYSNLLDHYESFKELPKFLDVDQSERIHDSSELDGSPLPRNDWTVQGLHLTTESEESSGNPGQQQPILNQASPSSPSVRPQVCNSMETLPEALPQPSVLPGKRSSQSKAAGIRKSHSSSLTSLGESTVSDKRPCKAQAKTVGTAPMDGVISPETDSGFVGSESSRLTPATRSPLRQRAGQRSVRKTEKGEGKPPPSPSATVSPQRWASETLQPWPSGMISEMEQESEHEHSLSEVEDPQSDRYTQLANQNLQYQGNSSPTAPYHHGDHLKAQSSGQLTNHHEALQSLQQEVNRLRECLERTLRHTSLPGPIETPSTLPVVSRLHKQPQSSTPLRSPLRTGEKERYGRREMSREENQRSESTPRPSPRRRSASVPRLPPQVHITTDSEHDQSECKPQTSRGIPVSFTTTRGRRKTRGDPGRQRSVPASAPPPGLDGVPVLQCVPLYSPVLCFSSPVATSSYSQPLYLSFNEDRASAARGHHGRWRSLSVDRRSLNSSLQRAIAAASSMRESSHRMARSLASGLHQQNLLTQSCTY